MPAGECLYRHVHELTIYLSAFTGVTLLHGIDNTALLVWNVHLYFPRQFSYMNSLHPGLPGQLPYTSKKCANPSNTH